MVIGSLFGTIQVWKPELKIKIRVEDRQRSRVRRAISRDLEQMKRRNSGKAITVDDTDVSMKRASDIHAPLAHRPSGTRQPASQANRQTNPAANIMRMAR
jgi:hypothetical protein